MFVLVYSFHFVKTGTNSPTGTPPGQQAKFRDCPGQTGTVGNYAIDIHENVFCRPDSVYHNLEQLLQRGGGGGADGYSQ